MELTEQKFYNSIKQYLPGDISRVENSVDVGMPDVNCTYLIDYWVELKVCSNINKIKPVTELLRDSQIIWNLRRGKVGALIFVAVLYEKFIVLYKWEEELFNGNIDEIEKAYRIMAIINKERNRFNYMFINEIIVGEIKERIKNGLRNTRTKR